MKRLRNLCLVLALLLLAGCAAEPVERVKLPEIPHFEMETLEESAQAFIAEAESLGYVTYRLDNMPLKEGAKPVTLIYAVNDFGDYMDYLLMDVKDTQLFDSIVEHPKSKVPFRCHTLECAKLTDDLDLEYPEAGGAFGYMTTPTGSYRYIHAASPLGNVDFGFIGNLTLDGRQVSLQSRPKDLVQQPGYLDEDTMQAAIDRVTEALQESPYGYTVQVTEETRTLLGKDFEVIRISAVNGEKDFAELYYSEDPSYCYYQMAQEGQLTQEHMEKVQDYMDYHGLVKDMLDPAQICSNQFFNGYSFFGVGSSYGLLDTGYRCYPGGTLGDVGREEIPCPAFKDRNTYYDTVAMKWAALQ